MNTARRCLFVLSALGYGLVAGAQPYHPTKSLTKGDWQILADEIGRIAPYVERKEIAGVLVIHPGTLFRALGIDPKDVVVELDGMTLTSLEDVQRFMVELAHAQSFELIVRSSDRVTRTVSCADRSAGCIGTAEPRR